MQGLFFFVWCVSGLLRYVRPVDEDLAVVAAVQHRQPLHLYWVLQVVVTGVSHEHGVPLAGTHGPEPNEGRVWGPERRRVQRGQGEQTLV